MSVTDDVREFIIDELDAGEIDGIGPDEDLLASGIIDSFGLEQLITFLQDRYRITIDPAHLTSADFRSLRSIDTFVSKQAER